MNVVFVMEEVSQRDNVIVMVILSIALETVVVMTILINAVSVTDQVLDMI